MAKAAVLAVSSRHEGFCNVIAEALACGCPVVSTDCPSGPAEILGDGRWGRLVPVGDDTAMAMALEATLAEPPDRASLRERAQAFSVAAAVDLRRALLDAVSATAQRVVLDLSRLTWIDSFGLGMLVTARRRLRSGGGDLVIWRPSRKAAAILVLSGVDQAIPVVPASVADPFAAVHGPATVATPAPGAASRGSA